MYSHRARIGAFVAGLITAAFLAMFGPGILKGRQDQPPAAPPTNSLPDLVTRVKRSIGRVDLVRRYTDTDAKTGKQSPGLAWISGTCFVIRSALVADNGATQNVELDVVTNNHLFTTPWSTHTYVGNESLFVTVYGMTTTSSSVLGRDALADLAAIRVRGQVAKGQMPAALPWADPDSVRVGDSVMAIGYAESIRGEPTVTRGIVSALHRSQPTSGGIQGTFGDLIQADASSNHGDSGGPLVNMRGEVIGVHTYQDAPTVTKDSSGNPQVSVVFGIFWSRSSRTAKPFVDQLVQNGKVTRINMGAAGKTVFAENNRFLGWPQGVLLTQVTAGSVTAQAGLQPGDIITAVGSAAQRPDTPAASQETTIFTTGNLNDELGLRNGDASVWVRYVRPDPAWWTAASANQYPVYTKGQTYVGYLR